MIFDPFPDPYYRSAPSEWVVEMTSRVTDYEIVVDDELVGMAITIERPYGLIRVRPGLGLRRLQLGLARTALGLVYPAAVPELTSRDSGPFVPPPRSKPVERCPWCGTATTGAEPMASAGEATV